MNDTPHIYYALYVFVDGRWTVQRTYKNEWWANFWMRQWKRKRYPALVLTLRHP